MMTISNITKNRMWIYERLDDRFSETLTCWVVLSHWMFGKNEMEAGDHITITVTPEWHGPLIVEVVKECGVSLVYEDGEKKDEEEDVLGYYKSWNHIIGGDLSSFQTTTGQYILDNLRFFDDAVRLYPHHRKFVPDGPEEQEQKEEYWFRALSPRKADILGRACEDVTR
ncbi:uncharacterized protein LOC122198234 isoform X2 [Lactuca sativa]|uniref:uncharacterized protein LOC122198234 isoform X2 n=1 Tax=Lactuca sativa TaxID=4236 RepID=UPI001C6873C4|nr:uncharacterized protein LOC122198234 isoform X2 [Lactuca sativa]